MNENIKNKTGELIFLYDSSRTYAMNYTVCEWIVKNIIKKLI